MIYKEYLEMASNRKWEFKDEVTPEQKKAIQKVMIGHTPGKVNITVNMPDKTVWKITGNIPGTLIVRKAS